MRLTQRYFGVGTVLRDAKNLNHTNWQAHHAWCAVVAQDTADQVLLSGAARH